MSTQALDALKRKKVGRWTRGTTRSYDDLTVRVESEGGLALVRSLSTAPWNDTTIYSEWTLDVSQRPNYLAEFLQMIPQRLAAYLTQMFRDGVIQRQDRVQIYATATDRRNHLDLTDAFSIQEVLETVRHGRNLIPGVIVDPDKIPVRDLVQSGDEDFLTTYERLEFVVIKVLRVDIPTVRPARPISVRADPVYSRVQGYALEHHGVYVAGQKPKIQGLCWLESIVASVIWQAREDATYTVQGVRLGGLNATNYSRDIVGKVLALRSCFDRPIGFEEDMFFEMVCAAFRIRLTVYDEATHALDREYGTLANYLWMVNVMETPACDGGWHWDAILNFHRFDTLLHDEERIQCRACLQTMKKSRWEDHNAGPKVKCERCLKKHIPETCFDQHRLKCKGITCKDCHQMVDGMHISLHKEEQCPKFTVTNDETMCRSYRKKAPYMNENGDDVNMDPGYMDEHGVTMQNVHAYDIESIDVDGNQVPWLVEIHGVGVFENDFQPGFAARIWTALSQLKGCHYFYAHNGSGYDTVLMQQLYLQALNDGWQEGKKARMSYCRTGSKIKQMMIFWSEEKIMVRVPGARNKFKKKTKVHQAMFLDTMNLMSGSLERLAKSLNLPPEYQKKQLVPYGYFQKDFVSYVGVIPKDAFNVDVTQAEYDEHFNDKVVNLRQLILDYLHQDVTMLHLILERLHATSTSQYGNSILGMMTVGQFAMDTFQRHDLFPEDEIPRLSIIQDALIRGDEVLPKKSIRRRRDGVVRPCGTYGGRTEVFHALNRFDLRCGQIHYIDIKSSYPHQMQARDLPGFGVSVDIYEGEGQVEAAEAFRENPDQFCHGMDGEYMSYLLVSLKMPPLAPGQTRHPIPWLPMHQDGKMVFSYEDRVATYFSEELIRALADGWVVDRVLERHVYERTRCLSEFMAWAYQRKEQWDVQARFFKGEALEAYEQELMDDLMRRFGSQQAIENACKANREFSKVFVNSIFGKFLQRLVFPKSEMVRDTERLQQIVHNSFLKTKSFYLLEGCIDIEYMDAAPIRESAVYDKDRNSAIGAAILAWGRIHLTEVMRHHGPNVIYCDTDSVIVYVPHGSSLLPEGHVMGEKLGNWVSETGNEPIMAFCCLAPKTYAWECPTNPDKGKRVNVKAKGFNLRAMISYSKNPLNCPNTEMNVAYYETIWQKMWAARDSSVAMESDTFRLMNMNRTRRGKEPGVNSMHEQTKQFRLVWSELKRCFARDGSSCPYENGQKEAVETWHAIRESVALPLDIQERILSFL